MFELIIQSSNLKYVIDLQLLLKQQYCLTNSFLFMIVTFRNFHIDFVHSFLDTPCVEVYRKKTVAFCVFLS